MRGLSITRYFAERDHVAGSVYVLLLIVFAAMPWVLGGRPPRSGEVSARTSLPK
jgi:hypothetical protein